MIYAESHGILYQTVSNSIFLSSCQLGLILPYPLAEVGTNDTVQCSYKRLELDLRAFLTETRGATHLTTSGERKILNVPHICIE
jgi:hypothetical protein